MNQTVQETTVKKRPRLFYGWVVVLGCSLLIGASTGLFSNCVSGFIKPVCETLDVSRGAFSLYSTIGGFVGMGAIVLYGELYQRHPLAIRKFILWGCVVCCSVFVGYSFATKLWHFYALAALFGTASSTLAGISVTTLVNNWFVDKRGLATGLAFAGSGLTAAVVLPIITRVLDTYGWRVGYRVLAALAAVLILLAVWLIRERPSQMGLTPLGVAEGEGERAAQTGLLREQALKTPEFWMLTGGFWCLSVAGMGMSTHVISFLTDIGYSTTTAASVMSVVLTVMTGAKVCLGGVFDRLGAVRSSVLTGLCMVVSVAALRFAGVSPVVPWIFALCFGFGWSTLTVPYSYLVGENFGTRQFAAIYSVCTMVSGVGGSFASPLSGALFDRFGSYLGVWSFYFFVALLATGLMTAASKGAQKKEYKLR